MKLSHITAYAALLAILTVSFPILTADASAKKPAPATSFEGSPGWEKLDLRFREAWKEAIEKGDTKQRLECIIKTKAPLKADEKAILSSAGFAARSTIGDIITGSVIVRDLQSVAALDFVQAMELAVPLSIKSGDQKGGKKPNSYLK